MWRKRENALKRKKGRNFKEAKIFQKQLELLQTVMNKWEYHDVQLSSSGTQQCSSSLSCRPTTAPCMQELSPAQPNSTEPAPHSQHKAPPPAMAAPTTHRQALDALCSEAFWMNMDIKALLFKAPTSPCICSNLPGTSQGSDTAMQLWADVGTACATKHRNSFLGCGVT